MPNKPICDIVIRTYSKDIEWLNYALRSIHKYVTGYRHIIVAIPYEEVHLLRHLTAEKVVGVADLDDGYLGQQLTKMQAWKLTNADAILFWDSDVVATRPINVRTEYFQCDRIIRYKTRYTSMECPWQPIAARSVGFTPEWEYMRRMPLTYWRSTLENCERFMVDLHGCSLEYYMTTQPHRQFSEFNTLGAFSEAHEQNGYVFVDTEAVHMPENKVFQGWSWGGITSEVKEKLASYGL